MIHLEAVYHRASQQFCYALDEEILMVGLQTGEEVEQVWIHYGDRFLPVFWAETRLGKAVGRRS